MKGLNIPVGVSDFVEIRQNGYYYVDKTGLICELLKTTGTKVTLITRPRRFGKTLTMSMLDNFFNIQKDSKSIFAGLEIAGQDALCREWMNRWPVIFVSFKQVDGLDFASAYEMLKQVVADVYKKHLYLLESEKIAEFDKQIIRRLVERKGSEAETKNSFGLLTNVMQAYYGQQVILLMDEYDVPVAKATSTG